MVTTTVSKKPPLILKPLWAALSFALPLGAFFARPLGLNAEQSLLLGVLVQVILAWSANLVHRDLASAYLVLWFLFVGKATPVQVLNFPLSENFVLIASAFLLSAAISKTGLADRLARMAFSKFARSPRSLVRFSYIVGGALIFLIPQPFPRVIIMASLYTSFLSKTRLDEETKAVLQFSIFTAATVTSMLFLNGDIVLNNAVLGFAGVSLSFVEWIAKMTVPALAVTVLSYLAFVRVFHISKRPFAEIASDSASPEAPAGIEEPSGKLSRDEIKVAILTVVLIALWISEPLHSLSAAWAAAIIVAALFAVGILKIRDFREINLSLIVFLTAAFSIGKVLAVNGIAQSLNERLFRLLPDFGSLWYFPVLALLVMALHMMLGSCVTTLSLVIPSLVMAMEGALPAVYAAFFAYSIVNMQYLLPIHQVTIMIGAGKGYYSQKQTMRFGVVQIGLVLVSISFIFVPWWKLIGAF